jgi:hypothetical protein
MNKKPFNTLRNALFAFSVIALNATTQAYAAIPATLNYQGMLTNASAQPVNNASLSITFSFYTAATGGAALYTETQTVSVSNGLFNVRIGAVTPIGLPFDVPYFLGISVGGDAEMNPRQPLASNAYAFRAATADALAPGATFSGSQISGVISNATIPAASVTGAGTVTSVATGPGLTGGPITATGTIGLAATNQLPLTACAANRIPKWDGSAWTCAMHNELPAGGAAGQVLVGSAMGPQWSATPQLTSLQLSGPLHSNGVITYAGSPFIRADGQNLFMGPNSGINAMAGTQNTAFGASAMSAVQAAAGNNTAIGSVAMVSLTTGSDNTAVGAASQLDNITGSRNTAVGALTLTNAKGSDNTALGAFAARFMTLGERNTALGSEALYSNKTGNDNTAAGYRALYSNIAGAGNTAVGKEALRDATSSFNTAVGERALAAAGTGTRNTAVGYTAMAAVGTGNDNIGIGYNTGIGITGGSNNINIGGSGTGNENDTIRIGGTQQETYIAGIRGANPGGTQRLVGINDLGQLATNVIYNGVGTDNPENRLHVVGIRDTTGHPDQHVMQIENTSTGTSPDVLALRVRTLGNVGGGVNFITFFNGNYIDGTMGAADQSLGSIQGNGSGGVEFASAGNDFAEYLPKLDPAEVMHPGEVVGVRGGKVTRDLTGAEQIMVVSTGAIVAGNDPGEARRGQFVLLAFIGQADVKVTGPVNAGDYLVAQGNRAIAVAPEAMRAAQLPLLVGRAWASSNEITEKPVRAVVGVDRGERLLLAELAQVQEVTRMLKEDVSAIKRVLGMN